VEYIYINRVDKEDKNIILNVIKHFKGEKGNLNEVFFPYKLIYSEFIENGYEGDKDMEIAEIGVGECYRFVKCRVDNGKIGEDINDNVYCVRLSELDSRRNKKYIWGIRGRRYFRIWANDVEESWYRYVIVDDISWSFRERPPV
jgi:hypothetical protein